MKTKKFLIIGYAYLILPVILFLVGWLRPQYGITVSALVLIGLYRTIQSSQPYCINEKSTKKMLAVIFVILAWVALSGLGGLVWQNPGDHVYRNALFNDISRNDWPVKNYEMPTTRTLTYYLGFWLPSAVVAKLFGMAAGYFFMYLYGAAGVIIALFLLFERLGKISVKATLLFVFFSGLDIFSYFIMSSRDNIPINDMIRGLLNFEHIELSLWEFNSSSNTTLLFWLFNQIIPFWVGFLLLWRAKGNGTLMFTYSLLFLFSPFPCAALAPVMVVRAMQNTSFSTKRLWSSITALARSLLTFANVAGLLLLIVIALYYQSNVSVSMLGTIPFIFSNIAKFIIYLLIEYVIFMPILWKRVKHDAFFWTMFFTTMVCGFFVLGNSHDFSWRTCIPLAFYIMVLVAEEIQHVNWKSLCGKFLLIVLLLGAITPMLEMLRTTKQTWLISTGQLGEPFISNTFVDEPYKGQELNSAFDPSRCQDNFVGSNDAFFFRYLAK